jgi:hypothetical protein
MSTFQKSPTLLDSLKNILIDGDSLKLSLFETAKLSILELGELEHTGDWDPYLHIVFTDGTHIETSSGYPEIIFGDFNKEEQSDFLKNHEEITSLGIYIDNPENEEEPLLKYIQLSKISKISLLR